MHNITQRMDQNISSYCKIVKNTPTKHNNICLHGCEIYRSFWPGLFRGNLFFFLGFQPFAGSTLNRTVRMVIRQRNEILEYAKKCSREGTRYSTEQVCKYSTLDFSLTCHGVLFPERCCQTDHFMFTIGGN